MARPATTKMSSRGQIVIPEAIRSRLGLRPGVQFVVVGSKDVVILKALTAPSMAEFNTLIKQARSQARKAGLRRSDIRAAVNKARGRR